VITGVESFGLFVTGVELPAEGFIHISGLTDDYYKYDRAGHVIEGFRSGNSYRLGDAVRVAVAAVDVDARQLDFRLLGRGSAPQRKGRTKGDKKTTPKHRRKAANRRPAKSRTERPAKRKTKGKIRHGKSERKTPNRRM